jgi:hypothetical protein
MGSTIAEMKFNNNGIIIKISNKETKIEYSKGNTHFIGIQNIFFDAIKNGIYAIEIKRING